MRNPISSSCGVRGADQFARERGAGRTLALVALLSLGSPAAVHSQGVTAALQPATVSVAPGADFDLVLQITQAGSPFNGLDAVIGFDPAALTLVSLTDAEQEGALITDACGDLFHRFQSSTSSAKATEVMLCNQTFVTGPGPVYRLRFHASSTAQATVVHWLTGTHFYNAGLYVTPLTTSDAVVRIGNVTGVEPGHSAGRTSVRALPNPARAATTIEVNAAGDTQELIVSDVAGRVVRHLEGGVTGAGMRRVAWDGRSDGGARVAPGVYQVTLRAGAELARTRVLMLR